MNVAAGIFKAKCLKLMEQVSQTGQEIVVTKFGRPLVKIMPVEPPEEPLFGRVNGTVDYHGDIIEPTGEAWDAEG